eukprot:m.365075 g.365075  ORF g.365075 m.365075 type:complete len:165 (+) comp20811_c0_seq7:1819-2313(+)
MHRQQPAVCCRHHVPCGVHVSWVVCVFEQCDCSQVTGVLWRHGVLSLCRFTKRIYIPMPNEHARGALVMQLLGTEKHTLKQADVTYISRATVGYSNSDLTALTGDAAYGPLRELGDKIRYVKQDKVRGINLVDFKDAMVNIRPSTSIESLQFFEDWNKAHGTSA